MNKLSLIVVALIALFMGLLRPAYADDVADRQISYEINDTKFSIGVLTLDPKGMAKVMIVISNLGKTPLGIAVLHHRSFSASLQSTLSDASGNACAAKRSADGLVAADGGRLSAYTDANLTQVPPRSKISTVFYFECSLSGGSFALSSEFAVSRNGSAVTAETVPFWGISPTKSK